ncbi:MAG: metal-dependent transcriptional regulator [Candidatus Spyradenecus sp.]
MNETAGNAGEKPFALTASLEDYLEAIKEIIDGSADAHAHTSEIAKRLNVAKPSVTYALGILRDQGFLNYNTSRPVTLTALGEAEASRVIRRHRVLTVFLRDVLRLDEGPAGQTACRIEHVIDEQVLARLEVLNQAFLASDAGEALRARVWNGFDEVTANAEEK